VKDQKLGFKIIFTKSLLFFIGKKIALGEFFEKHILPLPSFVMKTGQIQLISA
jgi:hypothetical protein